MVVGFPQKKFPLNFELDFCKTVEQSWDSLWEKEKKLLFFLLVFRTGDPPGFEKLLQRRLQLLRRLP